MNVPDVEIAVQSGDSSAGQMYGTPISLLRTDLRLVVEGCWLFRTLRKLQHACWCKGPSVLSAMTTMGLHYINFRLRVGPHSRLLQG